ncbi:thermonuclease family protein [Azohydromonas aeria]|uniref:thermonuclease family protein n=1 Tax=Azohydromonas aeria TaxID=2590212 RepID=UPI001E4B5135|nr:thermonuclease family protein [Azohydromonas aeria]
MKPRGRRPRRPWAVLLAAALLLGAAGSAPARAPAELHGRVTRVADGDTLWLAPRGGGRPLKLRLQGLDAPELCQAWGPQARAALQALVRGRELRARVITRDDYGRLLVRLHDAQGQDLGERLVREGAAWNDGWRRRPGPYAAQERAARALGLGLHADRAALHPREFRRRHGPCAAR